MRRNLGLTHDLRRPVPNSVLAGAEEPGGRNTLLSSMAIYSVVHSRHTGMAAAKEGWYVERTDGEATILDHRYETWPEAKAEADRLNRLEKSNA